MKLPGFLFLLITLLPQLTWSATIFGEDNRQDYFEIKDSEVQKLAESSLALILKDHLEPLADGRYRLKGEKLTKRFGFCDNAKFAEESQIANCSASLIAPDKILTAAHCLDLTNTYFNAMNKYVAVFGYYRTSQDQTDYIIEAKDIFELKESLFYELDFKSGMDLAVIKLDRPTHREPLKINQSGLPQIGTSIFMLGYPLGISLKLTDQSVLMSIDPKTQSFRHQLDTSSVNSGSPIFDAKTYEIIGVLVRGTGPNYQDQGRGCQEWGQGDEKKDYAEANYLGKLIGNDLDSI